MKIIEIRPREIGYVLWDHCQNLLDDPRMNDSVKNKKATITTVRSQREKVNPE